MDKLQELCNSHIQELLASKRSPVLSAEKFSAIVQHLKQPNDPVDAHFKHWVKSKKFQLTHIPALQLEDALVVPNPSAAKQVR